MEWRALFRWGFSCTFFPVGEPPNVYHWDGTDSSNASTFIINNNARFFLSLNACSGCHAGETQTAFTHVNPVFFGIKATLSGFLTGKAGAREPLILTILPTIQWL